MSAETSAAIIDRLREIDSLPSVVVDQKPRCWRCDRVLFGYAARPWQTKCQRCNAVNSSG